MERMNKRLRQSYVRTLPYSLHDGRELTLPKEEWNPGVVLNWLGRRSLGIDLA